MNYDMSTLPDHQITTLLHTASQRRDVAPGLYVPLLRCIRHEQLRRLESAQQAETRMRPLKLRLDEMFDADLATAIREANYLAYAFGVAAELERDSLRWAWFCALDFSLGILHLLGTEAMRRDERAPTPIN